MPVQFRCLVLVLVSLSVSAPLASQRRPALGPTPPDTVVEVDRVSPRGAFLRSLVLPGWGQAVVGAPGRGGVYFALESGTLWMLFRTRARLNDARAEERLLRDSGILGPDASFGLVSAREEQQQDWLVLAIFWLFFAGADAFVAAQLRDFDQHIGVLPEPDGALRIEASVPLRRR